jgi:hypothetical protein
MKGGMMEKCPYCKKREIIRSATCGDPVCQNQHANDRSSQWVKKYRVSKKTKDLEHALKV